MTKRRGQRFAFEVIEPRKRALVVIDLMQNFIAGTPCAGSVVEPINRLATALRTAGGTVAWVYSGPMSLEGALVEALWGPDFFQKNVMETADDSPHKELPDSLSPAADDIQVQKRDYSAFFPGKCDLHGLLKERKIDTLFIAGVLTNICCESSVRDAFSLGYKVIMVADANAARTDEEHQSSLYNILRNFGDVRLSDELISLLTP
ncbi:MAG: isochorismatase family cysteine hydrolase [Pseudomonadota bacterium]